MVAVKRDVPGQLIATRVMLALFLALTGVSTSAVAEEQTGDDAPPFALYAAADWGGRETDPFAEPQREFRRLDPLTLEDLDGEEPLVFDGAYSAVAISADGSTSAMVDAANVATLEDWIVVYDGLLERRRLSIDAEEQVYIRRLSADGSRLVAARAFYCDPYGCHENTWYTWDTSTGDLIATTRVDLGHYVGGTWVSPDGARLYVPFYEGPPRPRYPATPTTEEISEIGPWTLRIAAFDLTTGEEVGRVMVPDVMAGSWQVEPVGDLFYSQVLSPGVALSPDGETVAVVAAALETLTLIDGESLTVTAIHDIHEPESASVRVLRWLGILPATAEAKVAEGRSVGATFSADGQSLYLTGEEIDIGKTYEDVTGHGLGVLRVDVSNGEVSARALESRALSTLLPAPDGRSLYVMGPATPWWQGGGGQPSYTLHRLDAQSLRSMAERQLAGWATLFLAPVAQPRD